MDQEKIYEKLSEPINLAPKGPNHSSQNEEKNSSLELRLGIQPYSFASKKSQQGNIDVNNAVNSRKLKKSNREKLKRDKLNERFQELGNVLDPVRHKNDKKTIVISAIQAVKDLTSELSKLQCEHAALLQESNELTVENNELKEENTTLQSEVEILKAQYQQMIRFMIPCPPANPSAVMNHPPFFCPVAIPVRLGRFLFCSPPLRPMSLFTNQFLVPYETGSTSFPHLPPATPLIGQPSFSIASSSGISSREIGTSGPSAQERTDNGKKSDDSHDVVTDLELKTPGSSVRKLSAKEKGKQPLIED